jgi:DNA-binding helix-hairpin-helix protein with protein kinase domain
LHDPQGRRLDLGVPLASGGEGFIYPVEQDAGTLAKVYHQPPDAHKVEKLRYMVGAATPELCRFAAWPTATLHDTPGGPLVGFLMPHFRNYSPIHMLYSPAHRRTHFPSADWAFLIHAAKNCCSAFDAIHEQGHVIGDVNQSNVLISDQGLVGLIDCDSFQVTASDTVYRCEVGVAQYTPSELQGQSFRAVIRTSNHDRFGLAVLIFHLLFMGRHPFAGRFLGSAEMPLERAIEEFRFVYSEADPATQMAPPPFALLLATVGALGPLFERAFDRGAERPNGRPSAAEWHTALNDFQAHLGTCPREPGHKVPGHLVDCPWCTIIHNGGPNFFLGAGLVPSTFVLDRTILATIWQRIDAIPIRRYTQPRLPPPPDQPLAPAPLPLQALLGRTVSPRIDRFGVTLQKFGLLLLAALLYSCYAYGWHSLLIALAVLVPWWVVDGLADFWRKRFEAEIQRRLDGLEESAVKLDAAREEWRRVAARYKTEAPRLKEDLRQVKIRYESLQAEYDAERPVVRKPRKAGATPADPQHEARAREHYLRNQFLSDAKIPGIGPNRVVLLASYGIETAFEVTEEQLLPVKGIGPVLRENLLAWKEGVLREFHYDPQSSTEEPVPPDEATRARVFKYKQREETLRAQLQKGAIDLESLSAQTAEQLQAIRQRIEALFLKLCQAEVDWQAVSE